MIGTTKTLDRIDEVIKPIGKHFKIHTEKKRDMLKMLANKIELMTEISQYSPIGLVFYNYNLFIEKTDDKRLKEVRLKQYNPKVAEKIEL